LKVAGLSIEDKVAKVSFVAKYPGVIKPFRTEEVALPSAEEERAGVLREALARWKADYGIGGVVVGIGIRNFSFGLIDLPVRSRADIKNALAFEMEKRLPLPPSEYLYDFYPIREGKGSKSLVLSVRREKLGWLAESVRDTGLKLLGVKCSAIEVLNEFIASGAARDGLLIYSEPDAYCLIGLKKSVPIYCKVLHSPEEAASELERLAEDFGGKAFGFGPKAMPGGIKELPFSAPHLIALSALRGRAVELDFRLEEFVPVKADYYPYAIGALSLFAIVLFFLNSLLAYYKDYSALRTVEARIEEIKASAGGLVETKKNLDSIEQKTGFLTGFRKTKSVNIYALRELSAIIPEGAWLSSFSSDEKGKIEIEGYAKRAAAIVKPVEESALFGDVQFTAPVTVKDGLERFSLSMEIVK
jgi:hypothetical protein